MVGNMLVGLFWFAMMTAMLSVMGYAWWRGW